MSLLATDRSVGDHFVPGELATGTRSTITRTSVPTAPTGGASGIAVGDGDEVAATLGAGVAVSRGVDVGRVVALQAVSATASSTGGMRDDLPATRPFW